MKRNVLLASLAGAAALAVGALSAQAASVPQPLAGFSTDQANLVQSVNWRTYNWRWHHRHHHYRHYRWW